MAMSLWPHSLAHAVCTLSVSCLIILVLPLVLSIYRRFVRYRAA